jgi:hypothetical protein
VELVPEVFVIEPISPDSADAIATNARPNKGNKKGALRRPSCCGFAFGGIGVHHKITSIAALLGRGSNEGTPVHEPLCG